MAQQTIPNYPGISPEKADWLRRQEGGTKPQPVAAPEMPPPGTLGALVRALGVLPSRPLPVNAIQAPTAASMQALRNILAGDY